MNDLPCTSFFGQPTQPLHRRYEALRAVFLEHRPLPEVAEAFGYAYGSLRNLVTDFRTQCQAGQVPPFLPNHPAGGRVAQSLRCPPGRKNRPRPTAAKSTSPPGGVCARASPVFSCSCRCWRAWGSTNS